MLVNEMKLDFTYAGQSRINMDNARLNNLQVQEYLQLNLCTVQQMETLSILLDELEREPNLAGHPVNELGCVLTELLGFTVNNHLFEDAKKVYDLAVRFQDIQNRSVN